MSECERISDLFGDVHDNQVDGKIGKYVRDHLHNCPGCREEFKWYGFTVQAMNRLDRVAPPPDFLSQLNSKLETSPSFLHFFRNFFVGAPRVPLPVGVAALAFVVVMSVALYNNTPSITPRVATAPAVEQPQSMAPPSGARMAAADTRGMRAKSLATSAASPLYAMQGRTDFGFPTIADRIGADNLTVESPSIDNAVESLKKILPELQGRLVDEKSQRSVGETVVAVLIPSEAYGHLTTELINHGAVAAGAAGPDVSHAPTKKEGNNVLLYIRFVHTR